MGPERREIKGLGVARLLHSGLAMTRLPTLAVLTVASLALAACAPDEAEESGAEASEIVSPPGLGPEPSGERARSPIVLVHGFNGSPENEWGMSPRVVAALEADGHSVYVARLPPFAASEDRAAVLAREVDAARARFGADRVHIVAHSMGGVDARLVAAGAFRGAPAGARDRYAASIASITTISSPHRGTRIADLGLRVLPDPRSGSAASEVDRAVNALVALYAGTFTRADLAKNAALRAAMASMSEAAATTRNAAVPDQPEVFYQSWAGVSTVLGVGNGEEAAACAGARGDDLASGPRGRDLMSVRLLAMGAIVAAGAHIPNDGMVSVASARWGAFRGCIPADHYDEVGKPDRTGADRFSRFDPVRFYRNVAFELARFESDGFDRARSLPER